METKDLYGSPSKDQVELIFSPKEKSTYEGILPAPNLSSGIVVSPEMFCEVFGVHIPRLV